MSQADMLSPIEQALVRAMVSAIVKELRLGDARHVRDDGDEKGREGAEDTFSAQQ